MYANDIRKMTDEQILNAIEDQKEALFNLRFQQVMGKLTASGRPRVVKREIARIKTILRERELGV